jgi:DNA-binding NarL/FixJ family response regulator
MTNHGDIRSLLVLGRDTAFGNEDARRISSARRPLAALERAVLHLQPPRLDGGSQRVALTSRETQVLVLLSQGLLARSIAARLEVSERTVHRHLGSVYRKLGAHDRLLAVRRGRSLGLLPEDASAGSMLEPAG